MVCIVCFKKDVYKDCLQSEDEPTWLRRIRFCIPEVDWSINEQFCSTCVSQINNFYTFKNLCIQSYHTHRTKIEEELNFKSSNKTEDECNFDDVSIESPKNSPLNDDDSEFADVTVISENNERKPNLVTCFNCESKFETKEILEKHLKNDHLEIAAEHGKTGGKARSLGSDEILSNKSHVQNDIDLESEIKTNECSKSLEIKAAKPVKDKCVKEGRKPMRVQNDIDLKSRIETNEGSESLEIEVAKTVKEKCVKKGRKPVRSYSCEVCGRFFSFARNVVNHAIKEHEMDEKSIKPYSCDVCEMRFTCCANLLQHKKYHEKTRSLICAFCGKTFITKSDLTVHEHTHYNRRNYKCEKCDKAFNTNKTLRSHNLVCHTNPSLWKYCCSICGRRFPLKSGYDQHMKRHLGDKKHACHFCDKTFVSASELKKHIVFHSNVRAFRCHLCEKAYKEKKMCDIHLAKVHNIGHIKIPVRAKKFTCHVCGNMFADRQKLDRHLCTHTGLKPFSCDMCVKRFTDKSYLKHHKKVVHLVDSTMAPG